MEYTEGAAASIDTIQNSTKLPVPSLSTVGFVITLDIKSYYGIKLLKAGEII
jgi:hypothetical protein